MERKINSEQYPDYMENRNTINKILAFFLSCVFLNGLGTTALFLFSGKWDWYPAFILVCASLIVSILGIGVSFLTKRTLTIYGIFITCLFVCDLTLVFTFVALLTSMNQVWGSIFAVFLATLFLFLAPITLKKHANNFINALPENQAAGVINPQTSIWRVSVPMIRKSQEQDRKERMVSQAAVPFMYFAAVSLNQLLGKYNVIFILFLLLLFIYYAFIEMLFYVNTYKQINSMELQSRKTFLISRSRGK